MATTVIVFPELRYSYGQLMTEEQRLLLVLLNNGQIL